MAGLVSASYRRILGDLVHTKPIMHVYFLALMNGLVKLHFCTGVQNSPPDKVM